MSRSAWSSVTLLVAVMALAGCGDSPSAPGRAVTSSLSPAAGAEVSRGRTHKSSSGIATTCGGEMVTMTMVVDSQWHITVLAPFHVGSPPSLEGEWMLTQHTRFSVDGVRTTSGARYIGRGTANTTQVFAALNEGGAFTFTTVVRMQNIVQGSADNDVVVLHAKWTVYNYPDLQVSANLLNVDSDCRG